MAFIPCNIGGGSSGAGDPVLLGTGYSIQVGKTTSIPLSDSILNYKWLIVPQNPGDINLLRIARMISPSEITTTEKSTMLIYINSSGNPAVGAFYYRRSGHNTLYVRWSGVSPQSATMTIPIYGIK